jgi:hypothetical protein
MEEAFPPRYREALRQAAIELRAAARLSRQTAIEARVRSQALREHKLVAATVKREPPAPD